MELTNTDLLSLIISVLSLVSSIAIALILYSASKKIEIQGFSNTLRDCWIQTDSLVLSNDMLLTEMDYLLHPDQRDSTIAEKRRRWLSYLIANTLSVNYNGIKHNLLPDPKASEDSLIRSLEGLTRHKEFMDIVDYFYEKDFRDLCYNIHKRQKRDIEKTEAL